MVRAKRTAANKDTLPDEVFQRIRGALFFGAGFKVTRNKLLFRDNLQELLAASVTGEQHYCKLHFWQTSLLHAALLQASLLQTKLMQIRTWIDYKLSCSRRSHLLCVCVCLF